MQTTEASKQCTATLAQYTSGYEDHYMAHFYNCTTHITLFTQCKMQ